MRAVTAPGTRAEHMRQALDLNRMEAGEIRPAKTLSSPASSPKKRSVPLLSSHRLSARAASGGVGFLFSFALSASLCIFLCSCLLDHDASEDFFSRGAEACEFFCVKQHAREGVSRVAARKRRSLSRAAGDWNFTRARRRGADEPLSTKQAMSPAKQASRRMLRLRVGENYSLSGKVLFLESKRPPPACATLETRFRQKQSRSRLCRCRTPTPSASRL